MALQIIDKESGEIKMGGIFNPDSKFMIYGGRFADMMWLNVLFLCFTVPVITAGASYTAMHSVLLKIYWGEEYSVTKDFFYAFKKNLKQTTILWFLYLAVGLILCCDYNYLKSAEEIPVFFRYGIYFVTVIYLFSMCWVFILQSRYENNIKNTIRNSFLIGISNLLQTIVMMFLFCLPVLIVLLWIQMFPVVLMAGFTLAGILQTMLYSRVFKKLEGEDVEEKTKL